ncbi:LuxR C-terminal-related transcriptional regulator [Roseivivax marinus]|uniref:LuxR C-terminal-related transcriptional regulator n=1 Tax=Roseivivax marinus TaxID=1379903 RepID=UPI001F04BACC|nr:LuxR C-terminal-related transcriptional regulator [Roseivivax marinus]UMA66219.1 LuxR C-terminal-related transcriptional regulator [Roseivivax marinus]
MSNGSFARAAGLGAKLEAPKVGTDVVGRGDHVQRLREADGARLILLHAPSGFGKTVVMAQLLEEMRQHGGATAWLTLDTADNDAARLITGLQAALDRLFAASDAPNADADNDGTAMVELLDRVSGLAEPFALFLDDFETLHEDAVLTLVSRLIQTLPAHGRLVIGSRRLPDLPMARLRVSGEMVELDARALRFSRDETRAFLSATRAIDLEEADLTRLHAKTEGWPVALRLASIVLAETSDQSGFVQDFSGSDRLVSDYLAENILATQDAVVRDFLLRTSILRALEPALCEALVPGSDATALLERLASANALLNRIDGAAPVYRFHSLFAAYLRARLAREDPDALPRLHGAAMEWYLENERPVPAIDHGIAARATDHVLALVEEVGQACLEQGRIRLLTRWFDLLPKSRVAEAPRLALMKTWAYCFTRGPREAAVVLDECGLEEFGGSTGAEALSIRTMIRAMSDDFRGAAEIGRAALEQAGAASRYSRTVLANCMANAFSVLGAADAALENLDEARAELDGPDDAFNTMYSEAVQGLIDLQENRFREAKARFRLAAAARRSDDRRRFNGNAWAGVPLACVRYEENAQDEAEHLLQVFLPIVRDVSLPDHLILSHVTLSRIAFGHGQVDHAFRYLAELEQVGQRRRLDRVVAGARLERTRLYLRQGNVIAARHQIDRVGYDTLWQEIRDLRLPANDLDTREITGARVLVAEGRAQEALAILDAEIASAGPRHRKRRLLVLDFLRAGALLRSGETGRARDLIGEALRTSAREGYHRLIVDEGEAVADAVRAWAGPALAGDLPRRDPVFAEWLQEISDAIGSGHATGGAGVSVQAPLDPLTKKELQILRLLSEGYSNAAMSEKLFVSDSTVRTHLRNINSKLDTASRTQAVAAARQLGILG